MFKRKVECYIDKLNTTLVIDELSKYGTIKVVKFKDNQYQIIVKCKKNNVPRCLEDMFKLGVAGVGFRRPNIKWTL